MKNTDSKKYSKWYYAMTFGVIFFFCCTELKSETIEKSDTLATDTSLIITTTYTKTTTSVIPSSNQDYSVLKSKDELDKALNTISNNLNEVNHTLGKMVIGVDSIALLKQLDSIIFVCSRDLGIAIRELNSCVLKNDPTSMKAGLDVLVRLINMDINGEKIGASALSESFILSVSVSDLKQTSANLTALKEKIDKLKKEKSSKVKSLEMPKLALTLFQDKLISKAFENIMSQAKKNSMTNVTKTATTTTSVTRTVKK